jgi:hypothetical protein
MSMRGVPQAENGVKMRRGTRKFAGAIGMIVFVSISALPAKALAQTRPLQHTPGLVQLLWEAASHGQDRSDDAVGQLGGKPDLGT